MYEPFGLTSSERAARDTLTDVMTPQLFHATLGWLDRQLCWQVSGMAHPRLLNRINLTLRCGKGYSERGEWISLRTYLDDLTMTEPGPERARIFLRVIDYCLAAHPHGQEVCEGECRDELREILEAGGFRWTVGQRGEWVGLVDRVAPGVLEAAESTIVRADEHAAGPLLAKAWAQAYGVNPNPTGAYADAIRAVEAAARDVVEPNNEKATLGTMSARLRDPAVKWTGPWPDHPHVPTGQLVGDMCRVLYTGQTDRHGDPNWKPVTQAQAEAAVLLAVTLVGWFTTGAITQGTPS